MRFAFLWFCWLAIHQTGWAQSGTYFLSHYSPPGDQIDFRSVDIQQDAQGELYFATRNGVIEFDGKNWTLIPVASAVASLATQGTQVFVASLTGVGALSLKHDPARHYQELIPEPRIFKALRQGDLIYLCGQNKLIAYSVPEKAVSWTVLADSTHGDFKGMFLARQNLYVRTAKRGLLKVESQKLVASDITPGNLIFSSPSPDLNKYLIGMDDHRIFISESTGVRELLLKDQAFLNKNGLVTGVFVSDSLLALGTLRGGVLFVNPTTGATEQIIDYFSGLPDNEVYALMTDRSQGVWVAHEYGFTRIAPYIPFQSYAHFPGLSGNLLCAQTYQGHVYVGTTLGLFKLAPEPPKLPPAPAKPKPSKAQKKNQKQPPVVEPVMKVDSIVNQQYSYVKIEGITGRVTQLAEVKGKLIASGVSGVFEISPSDSRPLVQEPVRSVFFSPLLQQLFIGTYSERVKTYALSETGWQETHLVDSLVDFVSHVFEDPLENIWLCGRNQIFKIETIEGDLTDVVRIPIANPSRDETVGLAFGNDVYLAASGQFSRFDGKAFVKFDSLPGPRKYFATGGYFWFHDGTRWRTVDRRLQAFKLDWLRLFSNLRYLAPDNQRDGLWVITADNELYKFRHSTVVPATAGYPLFLTGIHGKEVEMTDHIEMEQHDGGVTFEFIQPDYVGYNTTQYRYQVKGLNTLWSSWSAANNIISLSYLPPGQYTLAVQSRDILGNESKVEQIAFRVLPPYWQRWWFYALEFTVFSLLVILSLRLGRASSRYRYVSQLLSLLTVVMLIQFLQTVLASLIGSKTSPVIDFIIQVFIAMIVFPVEIFARNAMIKYSQGKYVIDRAWDKK